MKDVFVAIHGHFYQPPRENPWLEIIETEESAHPFHDWNERIAFECYRPNAYARMVDGGGKILNIINNYSSISFNFGPTLFPWLEKKTPSVYQRIIQSDRESSKLFGSGNAMAQAYNHIILPLANERDKETEVLWGMTDFEKRFHRRPDAMWLPETAVNYSTLKVLIKYGMRYLILSPFQALRVRPFGGKKWTDASQGRIDPTQPYRCFLKDTSGKKILDQSIDIFFYDGMIAKELAFGDLLINGDAFCDRFAQAYQPSRKKPQLIHIATDGETYGHHKKFGEMALAYALERGFSSRGFEVINLEAFLRRFPPVNEVEIDEGPKQEGTSWSCAHGVGRWKEDCGCSTGGMPGWNQKWRKPLREALNSLRDELSLTFERTGEKIFRDVWEARNGYIEVILNRSPEGVKRFFEKHGRKDLSEEGKIKGIKLLEMQRHTLQMYTSCGWFFADLAGLETIIVLQHAARAIQLAEELTDKGIEERFLKHLSEAKSNLKEMGDGIQVYQRLVKPKWVTLDKVVNHYAISSLFIPMERENKVFSFLVERINYERIEKDSLLLVLGQVKVTSEIVPEPKEFFFGLIRSTQDIFRTWVIGSNEALCFDRLKKKLFGDFEKGEEEMSHTLTSLLGGRVFTIRDTFKEERPAIFQKLIAKEFTEHCRSYAELFENTKEIVEALAQEGFEIPYEIRVAAEITLSERLLNEVRELKSDFLETLKRGEIGRILEEAENHGFKLRTENSILLLNEILGEKTRILQRATGSDVGEVVQEIITFLDHCKKWGFKLSVEEAQDSVCEMLLECVEDIEACWIGEGGERPFFPHLVLLAERLGFNVERFSKMVGPGPE